MYRARLNAFVSLYINYVALQGLHFPRVSPSTTASVTSPHSRVTQISLSRTATSSKCKSKSYVQMSIESKDDLS